jgi:MFS family permease
MTRDLGLGPVGVGLVLATGGVGSLAGALVAAPAARRFGFGPVVIASALAFGLLALLVPLAVLFPRIALAMVVGSEFGQWMAILVYYVTAISIRQAMTPDRLMGRVNATMRFMAGGMMPVGALVGGLLGGAMGFPFTLVVASLGMTIGVIALVLSPVRRVHDLPAVA